MSKTRVTPRKFYVVDLVRNKPATTYVEIPVWRVDVQIDVTTTGLISAPEVPKSKLDRLEESARKALDRYEKVIAEEAAVLDAKIVALAKSPSETSRAEAQKMLETTNTMIRKALDSAEDAAAEAVEARLAVEAQGDSNLTEARVVTTLKVAKAAITLGTAVARLVPTAGADITAWVSVAKTMVDIGKEVAQQVKSEDTLRKDLLKAADAFVDFRGTVIMQAAKQAGLTSTSGLDVEQPAKAVEEIVDRVKSGGAAVLKGRTPARVLGEVKTFVEKGVRAKLNDVEDARTHYRENTTKMRQSTDSLSKQAGHLMKDVKAAKTLKDGVRIGAACMTLMHRVSAMAGKLDDQEKFLDEMERLLADHGMKIDDRTTLQKIQQFHLPTIAQAGKEVYDAASEVKDLVEALA